MPEIEIQHIVSFSSADKNNPAENLLKLDGSHKWKCATPGEKSVSCILQFSKCSQIHSIDIGNEGSAFVEILVGKSAATADKDFEVLLVASSFMSPLDSRNGTNRTSVRMFGPDKLNKATADKQWDRVKIICTQPFTKTTQYGLSFVKFHSPSDQKDTEAKTKKLGAFTLKPDSDDDADNIHVGSLFANRGKAETVLTPSLTGTGAAAIRAAGRLAEEHIKTAPLRKASGAAPAKRPAASPPPAQVQKKTKTVTVTKSSGSDTEEEETAIKPPLRKQSTSLSSTSSTSKRGDDGDATSALKRSKTLPATKSTAKEFSRLMEDVVFVLSGFQNPFRAELRDKAMEMGAKYRPDWGRGCTHLICAFQNTPKYQQVSGKGKIVTKSWITDCHKMKKLLPWRKYRLGDAESPDESSEDEEDTKAAPKPKASLQRKPTLEQSADKLKRNMPNTSRSTLPKKGVSFGSGSEPEESEEDTDDELRKAAERNKQKKKQQEKAETNPDQGKASAAKKEGDPYDVATDEEQDNPASKDEGGSDSGVPDLPEFFSDKHFFFYGDFESAERRLLTRYVAAYNGEEEDYMSKKVNFVVTSQKWDDNFEEALSENPNLVFVKPRWIFACHDKSKLLPYQPYIVVPH